jgi:hypothetical protein
MQLYCHIAIYWSRSFGEQWTNQTASASFVVSLFSVRVVESRVRDLTQALPVAEDVLEPLAVFVGLVSFSIITLSHHSVVH